MTALNGIDAADAALNNARWCDAVCRTHGRPGELSASLWVNRAAAPPRYPNLVTLDRSGEPALQAVRALGAAGLAGGWGVKDSFSTLPLHAAGFRVLFEAEWMVRPPDLRPPDRARSDIRWERIGSAAGLLDWETAWGESRGQPRVFLPGLVDCADIAILGAFDGSSIVAGVIANRTDEVVGVSNLFAPGPDAESLRADAVRAASDAFPGLSLVGYENGGALAASRALGFHSLGPLRVWVQQS